MGTCKLYILVKTALSILLISFGSVLFAQNTPIGHWRSHLPYDKALSIASDGVKIYTATEQAFYTYGIANDELSAYSKAKGMSDVGMAYVAYDQITGIAVLAYRNSNIDIFEDGSFYNIPDLKLKTVSGTKNINNIYTTDGLAYLSTDIGIVVVNLYKKEIKETYPFIKNSVTVPVKALAADKNNFYAMTSKGLYTIDKKNTKPQIFSEWAAVDTGRYFVSITSFNNHIYVTTVDSLFKLENNSLTEIYHSTDSTINNVDSGVNGIWICKSFSSNYSGQAIKFNPENNTVLDSFYVKGFPKKIIEQADTKIWIADEFHGLARRDYDYKETYYPRQPIGPNSYSSFDIYANNGEVWVAHGGYNQFYGYTNNGTGFSQFINESWNNYELYKYGPFGLNTYDFVKIIKGPDGSVYAGSTQSGLFILHPDGSYEHLKENSIIDSGIESGGNYRIHGLAFDQEGNLWINVFTGPHQLAVKTNDGNWFEYNIPLTGGEVPNGAENIIVDQNGLKWYSLAGQGGLVVFDDNGTIGNPADDSYRQLLTGEGSGNLPDNNVFSIVEDKNGAIWFGTGNGIGIINCPSEVLARQCEGELRIVQYDDFAGYLFQNEIVRALAVDGANRKWVGTNNGVWLISADGNEIINRFTAENSPLPSNQIQDIAIDQVTGDVYIGTEQGLVSYRGTSTEGEKQNSEVITFPNPVPSGYSGTIAIKGLVENADIRITDVSGQLVYRTKALGGQAVWNGLDYTGRRPQSGVYLIFATNRDGSETHIGKMVFME